VASLDAEQQSEVRLRFPQQPLYIGRLEWKRSSWAKDPEGVRRYATRPDEDKLARTAPELCIVPQELWNRVRERRARSALGRGPAISLGIASAKKRRGGAGSRYWLGSILTCRLCGANLIGDSRDDYVCPSHSYGGAAACGFDLRFRRSAIDAAVFSALEQTLLSDDAIASATDYVRTILKDRARNEAATDSAAGRSAELTKLDEQEIALRRLALPATAMAAAVAAIEHERAEILERATESRTRPQRRAERLIARLPLIVAEMRGLIGTGVRSLSTPARIAAAREATRKLLEGGQIVVKPNADHTAIAGEVSFAALGSHLLELARVRREMRATGVEKSLVNQLQEIMVAGA
jgi:hypothetical protein